MCPHPGPLASKFSSYQLLACLLHGRARTHVCTCVPDPGCPGVAFHLDLVLKQGHVSGLGVTGSTRPGGDPPSEDTQLPTLPVRPLSLRISSPRQRSPISHPLPIQPSCKENKAVGLCFPSPVCLSMKDRTARQGFNPEGRCDHMQSGKAGKATGNRGWKRNHNKTTHTENRM